MTNLYTRLAERLPERDRPFARSPGLDTMTYGGLETASARYAGALVSLGVDVGDRIAVQAGKSLEMLLFYLGCLRAGAVFLPLNPAYTTGELEYFLRDAEPALFVCDPNRREVAEALAAKVGGLKVQTLGEAGDGSLPTLAADVAPSFETVERADSDLAAILYTSNTTGRSKGAMLSHANLASNALTLQDYWRFSGDDVLLHALPIFHTHGLFVATNVVLAAGASMIFLPKFDPAQVLDLLPQATVMMGVPTFISACSPNPAGGRWAAFRGARRRRVI